MNALKNAVNNEVAVNVSVNSMWRLILTKIAYPI